MDRMDEFSALTEERTPAALEDCVKRARKKYYRRQTRRRLEGTLVSLGGVTVAFVLAVNLSLPFALACGKIPVVKELAAAVALSPSLKAAVENDFVQPVGESRTVNGVTMTVDYIIADKKQVNLFYHLDGNFARLRGQPRYQRPEGGQLTGWAGIGDVEDAPGVIRQAALDFSEGDAPERMKFIYDVTYLEQKPEEEGATAAPETFVGDDDVFEAPPTLFSFTFDLALDAEMLSQERVLDLNQWVELDGQRILLKTVEIYPTHMRLNLEDDPANTAWLKGLDFYFENERGQRNDKISNGVTASGSTGTPFMASLRQESTFFWKSTRLTLHMTGAEWLDKGRQFVDVDLAAGTTSSPLPDGVRFGGAVKTGTGAEIILFGAMPKGSDERHMVSYQIASWNYYGPGGEKRSIHSRGSTHSEEIMLGQTLLPIPDGYFCENLSLDDCPWDTVRLEMTFSRNETFESTVSVDLTQPL